MVITVTCPSCASSFPVDPAKIPEGGVNARCSSCQEIFRVEKPAEELPTIEDLAPAPGFEAPPAAESEPTPPPLPDPTPTFADPERRVPEPPEPPAVSEMPAMPAAEAPPDPFAQAAPFEQAAPVEADPAPAAVTPEPPAPPSVQGFTFGKRDPTDKAKRLARVLVSDMIMYNAERHQTALAQGTLQQDFEEEIDKSWKEYVDQVGEELANGPGRAFWRDALNDILAKGQEVF